LILPLQSTKTKIFWKTLSTVNMDTLRNPFEHDLHINNKRQDCKIGTVCMAGVILEGERMNE
jgi:hypothetical protein